MEHYRKGSHSVYDLKIHIVWITKYRKPVLFGDVAVRLRELTREICKSLDAEILKGHVSKDHVHLFLSIPPHLSVSKLVGRIKGKTSRKLLSENRRLSKPSKLCIRYRITGTIINSRITGENYEC